MLKWDPKAKQNLNFFNKLEGPWFVTSGKVMGGIGWHETSSCGQELSTAASAMPHNSSRNFGEQDFVTSHKPWSLQSSDFVKKFKFCLA